MNKQKKSVDQNPGQFINLLMKMKTVLQMMWSVLLHFLLKAVAGDFSHSWLLMSVPLDGLLWGCKLLVKASFQMNVQKYRQPLAGDVPWT